MLLTTLITCFLCPFLAFAAIPYPKPPFPYSQPLFPIGITTACFTVSGSGPGQGWLPTTKSTKMWSPATVTSTRTSTVTTTVTPIVTASVVATSTSTATTTLPASTSTFTSTITSTSAILTSTITTTTVQTTSTATTTSTTTSTTTIPPPAGFTPIYQSSGYTSLNGVAEQKRDVLDRLRNVLRSSPAPRQGPKGKQWSPSPLYVKCVTHAQTTSTVFTTVTITSTATAAPTTTSVTSTTTVTTTATVIPPIVTSTLSTTTTTTTTTTSTQTSTTTNTISTTTTQTQTNTFSFYQACATNNILGPQIQSGQYIQGIGNSDPNGIQANVVAASPYDCCVRCITGADVANCQNTIYDADTGICNPIGGDTAVCPNGVQGASGYVILTDAVFNRYDINGPCGTVGPSP